MDIDDDCTCDGYFSCQYRHAEAMLQAAETHLGQAVATLDTFEEYVDSVWEQLSGEEHMALGLRFAEVEKLIASSTLEVR